MAEQRPPAAIVLAAGSSTRLGQPKQLVCYAGEPLLRRAARLAFEVGARPVIVVLGAQAADCRNLLGGLPVNVIENEEYASGMGSSLRLGMAALATLQPEAGRVLLLVCDQPLLRAEQLRELLGTPAPDGIAAAEYCGRLGVPAVFGREHFSALASVSGDAGARALLRALPIRAVPMPEAAVDIDTPDDLRAL